MHDQSPQSCTTIAHQAPLFMGFFRQEYWSGCHALLQEIFPTQGLNPRLLRYRHILCLWPPGKPKLGHKRLNLPRIMDLVSDGGKFEPKW